MGMNLFNRLATKIQSYIFSNNLVGTVESIKLYDLRNVGDYFRESFLFGFNLFSGFNPLAAALVKRNVISVFNGPTPFRGDIRFLRWDRSIQLKFPNTRDLEVDGVFVALALGALFNRICDVSDGSCESGVEFNFGAFE